MKLNKPIALGVTAEIYAWKADHVLKLYHNWVSPDYISNEARITRIAKSSGLPVPNVDELIEINGRHGLIFERIEGRTIWDYIDKRPLSFFWSAQVLAELQVEVHGKNNLIDIPDQHQRLAEKIQSAESLPRDDKKAVLKALSKMPKVDSLCHGDFHPGNILVTENGPIIIDWLDATIGNPIADVARLWILLSQESAPHSSKPWIIKLLLKWYKKIYLQSYLKLRPFNQQQFFAWIPIVAAVRLDDKVPANVESWLLSLINNQTVYKKLKEDFHLTNG